MPDARARRRPLTSLAAVTLGLALLALLTPLSAAGYPVSRVGWLLAIAAAIEALHALRRSTASARRQASVGAAISMLIAVVVINAPFLAGQALRLLVAGWFAVDVVRHTVEVVRQPIGEQRWRTVSAAVANAAVVLLLVVFRELALTWVVALAGALRIAGIAWNIVVAPIYDVSEAPEM